VLVLVLLLHQEAEGHLLDHRLDLVGHRAMLLEDAAKRSATDPQALPSMPRAAKSNDNAAQRGAGSTKPLNQHVYLFVSEPDPADTRHFVWWRSPKTHATLGLG
jgi:hypothetical protein